MTVTAMRQSIWGQLTDESDEEDLVTEHWV